MNNEQHSAREERFIRRYDYEDQWVFAADLGVDDEHVDVDVVGTTAIVVIDHGDSEASNTSGNTASRVSEAEFELPGTDATVDINNGVLTITIQK